MHFLGFGCEKAIIKKCKNEELSRYNDEPESGAPPSNHPIQRQLKIPTGRDQLEITGAGRIPDLTYVSSSFTKPSRSSARS
jgi:hypothetical protein